jgi:hypothetical protein
VKFLMTFLYGIKKVFTQQVSRLSVVRNATSITARSQERNIFLYNEHRVYRISVF